LKIVDDHTILGKAFMGTPEPGKEMLTFSMSRKYPFEFMTEDDHEMLYSKMKKPTLDLMVGVWDGYLISDSAWTPSTFRLRFYMENGVLKDDYIFGNRFSGAAEVIEKADHIEMHDVTGSFHDEIRKINENILIGKYYAPASELFKYIPGGISFFHADQSKSRSYLPYVLKRIGEDSAFRGYTTDANK